MIAGKIDNCQITLDYSASILSVAQINHYRLLSGVVFTHHTVSACHSIQPSTQFWYTRRQTRWSGEIFLLSSLQLYAKEREGEHTEMSNKNSCRSAFEEHDRLSIIWNALSNWILILGLDSIQKREGTIAIGQVSSLVKNTSIELRHWRVKLFERQEIGECQFDQWILLIICIFLFISEPKLEECVLTFHRPSLRIRSTKSRIVSFVFASVSFVSFVHWIQSEIEITRATHCRNQQGILARYFRTHVTISLSISISLTLSIVMRI